MTNNNTKKRQLSCTVVSDKMDKTCVVEVNRLKKHPLYLKHYKVNKRFKAHDESNEYKEGDKVIVEESRPYSKDKRWTIVGGINKKSRVQHETQNTQS